MFSGVVGVEKPYPRIYEAALRQAGGGGVAPGERGAPHRRQPAQGLRPRAEPRDARAAAGPIRDRRGGALAAVRRARAGVLPDLVAAQEWLAGGHGHREEGQLAPGRPVLLARASA